jgi:3',5'-cyclic AMP phosphodiesterase CpdA
MRIDSKLTRRQLLRLSGGSLLAAGVWPGALAAEGKGHPADFHFLVVNDIHYLDKACGRWLEDVIRRMNGHKEKPDFCLVAGDLAEHGRKEQLAAMRDLLKTLAMPAHVVIGNHDYLAPTDRKAQDHLTPTDRKAFEELFPDRLNYKFEHAGWQFIALDTTEGLKTRDTTIPAATFKWLDDKLPKLDKQRPTVVFTHFPMAVLTLQGKPKNAAEFVKRFKEHNLQAMFCGHWHGFTKVFDGRTIFTTNVCCSHSRQNHDGKKEKGYFLCHAKDGKIERKFIQVHA